MKPKNKATITTEPTSSAPLTVEVSERLTDEDKSLLETTKSKRENLVQTAKLAVANAENSELTYNNIILQFALKYKLVDGDKIEEDGSIIRVNSTKEQE